MEGTSFALQMARPSHGCDDYVKIAVLSPEGDIKNSVHNNTYLCAKYIDTQIKYFFPATGVGGGGGRLLGNHLYSLYLLYAIL